jgi:hypothetical protein
MGSFWKITSSRMKFCVMLCNLLIRLINCSPPEVTVSRLLVQFNVILCMYSMCMNDLLFMIIITLATSSGELSPVLLVSPVRLVMSWILLIMLLLCLRP